MDCTALSNGAKGAYSPRAAFTRHMPILDEKASSALGWQKASLGFLMS
jgi:hypothetical protein